MKYFLDEKVCQSMRQTERTCYILYWLLSKSDYSVLSFWEMHLFIFFARVTLYDRYHTHVFMVNMLKRWRRGGASPIFTGSQRGAPLLPKSLLGQNQLNNKGSVFLCSSPFLLNTSIHSAVLLLFRSHKHPHTGNWIWDTSASSFMSLSDTFFCVLFPPLEGGNDFLSSQSAHKEFFVCTLQSNPPTSLLCASVCVLRAQRDDKRISLACVDSKHRPTLTSLHVSYVPS